MVFIVLLLQFTFPVNTNWVLSDYYNSLVKKEQKKDNIKKGVLITIGLTIHALVIYSTVDYYKRIK